VKGENEQDSSGRSLKPLSVPVKTAANLLGVGTTTTWGLIAAEKLDVIRLGRRTLVTMASLEALVARLAPHHLKPEVPEESPDGKVVKMTQKEELVKKSSLQRRSARKHLAREIVERFADGHWHTRTDIDEALPQYPTEEIEAVLRAMCKGRYGAQAEQGKTKPETYRIDKTVSIHQLTKEFGPPIKEMSEASQALVKLTADMSPEEQDYFTNLDRVIRRLKQVFERLTKPAPD
jgi:hypothetical protein